MLTDIRVLSSNICTTSAKLCHQSVVKVLMLIPVMQLEDDLLYKLSSAEGDMTEDLALIESLEESKRVADEISEKVAEAKTTEEQINEARNKVCP